MNSNSNSNMNGNSNSNSNRLTQFQIYSELSMLIDNARQLIQKQSININNNDNDKDKYINSTVRQFICNQ